MLSRLKAKLTFVLASCGAFIVGVIMLSPYIFEYFNVPQIKRVKLFNSYESCVLPSLDPWDKSIRRYLDPNYKPMDGCVPSFRPITRVRNGRVELIKELSGNVNDCFLRCNYPVSDYDVRFGEWRNISYKPDCDVFEVYCTDATGKVAYEYAHAQIFVADEHSEPEVTSSTQGSLRSSRATSVPHGPPTEARPPDVHMLILDSVSSTQLTRSMPKSLHFLYNEMGAVNFRFVNKNGLNSRPNAYALLFGKQTYNLTDDAGATGSTFEADVDGEQLCYTPLDDEPFIAFDFQRRGYKTMMAEDWALGAVNWFNCTGFKRPPMDHYMRPFQFLYDHSEDWSYWSRFTDDQCRGIHLYLLDYFKDFLDAYPSQPKFSLTWISYLSHDTPNGVYELDDQLLEILKEYKNKLSNSFLFLMGDHGLRFGKIRATRQGEIEDNNPALVMTVPERLRSNKMLMANLNANSKHLVTHYDTYATLLNIATDGEQVSSESPFSGTYKPPNNITLHGESYLYPFKTDTPRNCARQRIPFEYCICQNSVEDVSKPKAELARRVAAFVVDQINAIVKVKLHKVSQLCAPLSTGTEEGDVELLQENSSEGRYRISVRTEPNDARYSTHVQVSNEDSVGGKEHFSLAAQKIARLDSYEKQSRCVKKLYNVRPFCYCRDQTSNEADE